MRLYYKIWVDLIVRARMQPENRNQWKLGCMIFMTIAMAANLLLLMTFLELYVLKSYSLKLSITFLPRFVSNVISYIVLIILPCVLINYFLIFRNAKYQKLINRYTNYNGKLFLGYFFTSMFFPLFLILIAFIRQKFVNQIILS